jgi:hypothetical protein
VPIHAEEGAFVLVTSLPYPVLNAHAEPLGFLRFLGEEGGSGE